MGTARRFAAIFGMLLAGCAALDAGAPPEARTALAPTHALRVGLLLGDATQAVKDPATGAMKGVGFDLGRELARRIGVGFEPVTYTSIGALLDKGKAGAWDVAFIGFTPDRARDWDFAPPHVEVEFGYLVAAGAPLANMASIDRPGVRIAVQERSGPDAFISRSVKNATVLRTVNYDAALQMQREGKADVVFSIKPILFELSPRLPGSRVLDDRPGVVPQALALPKGRNPAALEYARKFVADAKADGTVRAAIERAGLRGVVVADPAQVPR